VKEYGIGAVPGSSFFNENVNNWIRLHFAKNKETLNEVLRRLAKLKKSYRKEEVV
jgi:aminotransferase